jgi:hypothetical protein
MFPALVVSVPFGILEPFRWNCYKHFETSDPVRSINDSDKDTHSCHKMIEWPIDRSCGWGETTFLNCGHQRIITQMIYGYGEQWWNDIDRGISWLVHQSALWQSYQQSYGSKSGRTTLTKEMNLAFESSLFAFRNFFYTHFFHIRRKACCGLSSPLKSIVLGWVWIREPWDQWQAR